MHGPHALCSTPRACQMLPYTLTHSSCRFTSFGDTLGLILAIACMEKQVYHTQHLSVPGWSMHKGWSSKA
jgi:hypothetical protein